MILAVIERHLGVQLHDQDVYVSTVGGIKLSEPAADLAIAFAIISSLKNVPLDRTISAFGELSLAAQVRPVAGAAQRSREAQRLGYSRVIADETETIEGACIAAKLPTREGSKSERADAKA